MQVAFIPGGEGKVAKHFGIDGTSIVDQEECLSADMSATHSVLYVVLLTEENLPAVVFVTPAGSKFLVGDVGTLDEASAKQFITKALTLDAAAVEQLASVPLFPTPELAKKKPKTQLKRLDEATMRACLQKSGKMCVVVARASSGDNESAASDKDAFGETLKSLAKTYRRDPFQFLASDTDATVFKALKSFLGTPESEVVVVKPGRKVKFLSTLLLAAVC